MAKTMVRVNIQKYILIRLFLKSINESPTTITSVDANEISNK
jgi:hypothetical protein